MELCITGVAVEQGQQQHKLLLGGIHLPDGGHTVAQISLMHLGQPNIWKLCFLMRILRKTVGKTRLLVIGQRAEPKAIDELEA